MIRTENVVKKFDGFTALDHVNMRVDQGAVYGLVGPNGAGKSTLIRHITGIYRQDEGEIEIAGEPIWENNSIKEQIAYIPDDIFYFMNADIRGMEAFYRNVYPNFDRELFQKLRGCFPEVDTKRAIRRMSKGMQKQAAFWLSICIKPRLLVLDEPVDGLDPVMRRQVWSLLISEVAEHETTVLVSSHNLRELEDVCDHVGIMHHGELIMERSLTDLQSGVTKVQAAFAEELSQMPEDMEILYRARTGRVHTFIVRGSNEAVKKRMAALHPILLDVLPLTLEEIFIYELGGADYEVKDILI